jgi:integrase
MRSTRRRRDVRDAASPALAGDLCGRSLTALGHTYTSHLIVGLELDAATASKLAGHANPKVTMRVYVDDFRRAPERNAAVLARAAERGFGT